MPKKYRKYEKTELRRLIEKKKILLNKNLTTICEEVKVKYITFINYIGGNKPSPSNFGRRLSKVLKLTDEERVRVEMILLFYREKITIDFTESEKDVKIMYQALKNYYEKVYEEKEEK